MEYNSNISRYVLRKKPPGKLLQSAHAIEREYQVVIILISSSMIFFFLFSSSSLLHVFIHSLLGMKPIMLYIAMDLPHVGWLVGQCP